MNLTSRSLEAVDLRVFADEELGRELGARGSGSDLAVCWKRYGSISILIACKPWVGLTDVLNELEARNQDISGGRIGRF